MSAIKDAGLYSEVGCSQDQTVGDAMSPVTGRQPVRLFDRIWWE